MAGLFDKKGIRYQVGNYRILIMGNRKIKFRIWSCERGKFDFDVGLKDFKQYPFPLGQNCVQQFTGLKDDFGKEIYDGDLILGDSYGPYCVFWDDDFGGWCSCCYSDAELISNYKSIKVVGHVFDGTEYEGVQYGWF